MNYSEKLEELLHKIIASGQKPRLLLHVCCAPCASYCLQYLKDFFDITAVYYNPNIDELSEYNKRGAELERFAAEFCNSVKVVILPWNENSFLEAVKGFEHCKEGGKRCEICYLLRLEKTAQMAKDSGFDYFSSTLSISPLKNSQKLNEIGQALAEKYKINHLPNDFKKKNGYLQSTILAKKYGLYRQNYCGCKFSKA